jgi:hypothetical protein
MAGTATRGSTYVDAITLTIGELRALAHRHYEKQDVCDLLVREGARLEIFVKTTWFPTLSANSTLNHLIGQLPISASTDAAVLHEFRKAYNAAKHDPVNTPALLELDSLLQRLRDAVARVNAIGLGITNTVTSASSKRVFWLAAWDHYIGGDTEIHFMFPGDTQHWLGPPEFDMIYIDALRWDAAKTALGQVGLLRDGRGIIPQRFLEAWEKEGDFLAALVFEGEYRDLLTAVGQFELRQELIVGLNRGDNASQSWVGALLACVDTASSGTVPPDLTEAIKARAQAVYALRKDSHGLSEVSAALANIIIAVPANLWPHITGPVWVDQDKFAGMCRESHAHSMKPPVLVDKLLRLVTVQS